MKLISHMPAPHAIYKVTKQTDSDPSQAKQSSYSQNQVFLQFDTCYRELHLYVPDKTASGCYNTVIFLLRCACLCRCVWQLLLIMARAGVLVAIERLWLCF